MALIHSIYRYPVKGLSPEALPRIALAAGETVPGDRLYAIENFDPSAPAYLSLATAEIRCQIFSGNGT